MHSVITVVFLLNQSRDEEPFLISSNLFYFFVSPGLLWTECKQLYTSGIREYLLDKYNAIDFLVISLYLASYALRFLVDYWVREADRYYNGVNRARDALYRNNTTLYEEIKNEIFNDTSDPKKSYFMQACK